jgi:hypothetical protein
MLVYNPPRSLALRNSPPAILECNKLVTEQRNSFSIKALFEASPYRPSILQVFEDGLLNQGVVPAA